MYNYFIAISKIARYSWAVWIVLSIWLIFRIEFNYISSMRATNMWVICTALTFVVYELGKLLCVISSIIFSKKGANI